MSKNPIPQGKYKPAVRYGSFVFTAGMTPRKDGVMIKSGKVSMDSPVEEFRDAVRQATENALTAVENCLNDGESIAQIMTLTVYVNSESDYTLQAKIGDLASEFLLEKLGNRGIGARAAVSAASLPGNAPVEVQIVAAVE